ncbi:MAG: MBL fold metallo-hydrolase [Pseudomonadota bacterium]
MRRDDDQPGVSHRLSPRIRRVLAPNPGPFTYTGTGVYIVGDDPVAVIDPGPDVAEHTSAILAAVGDAAVSHILITHSHLDHCAGAAALKAATGAPICGFRADRPKRMDAPASQPNIVEEGADLTFAPDRHLATGDIVEGEGWTLKALHTPGHTADHLCYELVEERALFTGDHVMGWATSVVAPPDGRMADYLNSLALLADRTDEIYWPTHGPPVENPQTFVRAIIAHRRMRDGQILRFAVEPVSVQGLVEKMYEGLEPRLRPAAALSVYAHLERLVEIGAVRREGPPTMDAVFQAAS